MPLLIEDDATVGLVEMLAKRLGISQQAAVEQAVRAEFDRLKEAIPVHVWLETFWRDNPLPPPTGKLADKAFFDELSGDL